LILRARHLLEIRHEEDGPEEAASEDQAEGRKEEVGVASMPA
jgi:hypothetical protein